MKKRIVVLLAIYLGMFMNVAKASDPSFTVNNTSSFYLNNQPADAKCPAQIAPGQSAQAQSYWCGFVACATNQYDSDKGCLEKSGTDKTTLVQGGYATWFSISFGTKTCSVPDGNIYSCKWDNSNFALDYLAVTQKYSAGPKQGQPVTLPSTISQYTNGPSLRGVNVSGLEYDGTFLDAMYQHPDLPDVRYFAEQGMNTIRLPIRWEFVLGSQGDSVTSTDPHSVYLNEMYLKSIYDTAQKYLAAGLTVDMDLHNYMRFCPTGALQGQANEPTDPIGNGCQLVTPDQLAYIWDVLATRFAPLAKQYPKQLVFELMNEPFWDAHSGQQLKTADVLSAEAAAVKAIRAHQINNLILLSGNYWDPLHDWTTNVPAGDTDVPNGTVFTAVNLQNAGITGDVAIDMHQYFDSDFSGRNAICNAYSSYDDFKQKLGLNELAKWIAQNQMKVFLGEFGAADNATCQQDLNYMLQYVNENAYSPNKGGFIGWTAWRANRHGNQGFSLFNFLQAEDGDVYAAQGTPLAGTGIVLGPGNGLMQDTFANYLTKPAAK